MARRLWIYVSKTDLAETYATIAEQAVAQAEADAHLGVANWREWDFTPRIGGPLGELVNLARERVPSADGTGRWRWRTVADVIKHWLGEMAVVVCPACDQPTTEDKTLEIRQLIAEHRARVAALEARVADLEAELAAAPADTG